MRYLITGVHGMAGSHLADHLVRETSGSVAGIARSHEKLQVGEPSIQMYVVDLLDYGAVKDCLADFRPDAIFHLAAQTFVPEAWENPQQTFMNNTLSQMNLFQAVVELGLDPVIHVASSGEVYGIVEPAEMPLREEQAYRPTNPYGLSKVAQEYIAKQYEESHQLKIVITRTFNHTGPRRGEQYVESSFAKQLVEIELGLRRSEIVVGNLTAKREFMDVRDVVRAYADLVHSGVAGKTYQICTGHVVTIAELLDTLIALTGQSVNIVQDPSRFRKVDVPVLYGDPQKIHASISWRPHYTLRETLADLLEYWRDELRAETISIQA